MSRERDSPICYPLPTSLLSHLGSIARAYCFATYTAARFESCFPIPLSSCEIMWPTKHSTASLASSSSLGKPAAPSTRHSHTSSDPLSLWGDSQFQGSPAVPYNKTALSAPGQSGHGHNTPPNNGGAPTQLSRPSHIRKSRSSWYFIIVVAYSNFLSAASIHPLLAAPQPPNNPLVLLDFAKSPDRLCLSKPFAPQNLNDSALAPSRTACFSPQHPPTISIALISGFPREQWPMVQLVAPTVADVLSGLHSVLNKPLPPAEVPRGMVPNRGGPVFRLSLAGRRTCFGGLVLRPDGSGIYEVRFVDPPQGSGR